MIPMTDNTPGRGEIARCWDRISRSYNEHRQEPWPGVVDFVASLPPISEMGHEPRAIDIGCGNGRHSILLLERGYVVEAVDISPEMLETARSFVKSCHADHVDLFRTNLATAQDLPHDKASMDVALSVATIQLIPERDMRRSAIAELHRIVRPGGQILITTWKKEQPRFQEGPSDRVVTWRVGDGEDDVIDRLYHLYTGEEFEEDVTMVSWSGVRFLSDERNHSVRLVR